MKKIQLTEAEIKTIEAYKNDEINTYSPEIQRIRRTWIA